ncbi:MAG: hypothetical protein R3C59_22440 [Planctomycetaceae bacterium]
MADIAEIHELLESVRVTLASSMNPVKEELERLHGELDHEIRTANKRLRECDALLADGHRSEAIQLAEQEPNLLEVVSILDFPELAEWNDFVAELGLTVTPELQIDIATDINGAYSDDEPLERLLKKFRLLSLARAPLRNRIDLLRQIAKHDVGTAYWKDDLKSYEQVRIRQIADEARDAIAGRNHVKIRELSDEVHKKPWFLKPDRRVVERLDQAMVEVKKLEAAALLGRLTQELVAAQRAGNEAQVRSLYDKWTELANRCDPSSTAYSKAQTDVAPVVTWLQELGNREEQEQRFAADVKKLQKALRSERSGLEDIYRYYDALAEYDDFDIPETVQQMYEARIVQIEKQQAMKKYMTIGGVAVGVIVILAVAAYMIFS